MRMSEMNEYFESKGFEVKREYHSCDTDCNRGYYTFVISKGDDHYSGVYHWPDDQQKFMDKMIDKFEKDFPMYKKITIGDVLSSRSIKYFEELARRMDCNFKVTHTEDEHGSHLYFYISYKSNCRVFNSSVQIPYPCVFNIETIHNEVKRVIYSLFDRMQEELRKINHLNEEMWTKMNPWITTNFKIKNVIFNDPATIVFWTDGSKTVVKCQDDDVFDPEKGLAMAISKKALGNKGNYCNELKKWLPKEESKIPVEFIDNSRILIDIPKEGNYIEILGHRIDGFESFQAFCEYLNKIAEKDEAVKKAYDILVACRDKGEPFTFDEVIGYLGEALED